MGAPATWNEAGIAQDSPRAGGERGWRGREGGSDGKGVKIFWHCDAVVCLFPHIDLELKQHHHHLRIHGTEAGKSMSVVPRSLPEAGDWR